MLNGLQTRGARVNYRFAFGHTWTPRPTAANARDYPRSVRSNISFARNCVGIPTFPVRALSQDQRSGRAAQCQPEYPARVGAPVRVPQASALTRTAPPLHPRRGRLTARRAPGAAVALVGCFP